MKRLLRPLHPPEPEMIQDVMSLAASTFQWRSQHDFSARKMKILRIIQEFVDSPRVALENEGEGVQQSFLGTYGFTKRASPEWHGSACFSYTPGQRQKGALSIDLSWQSVAHSSTRIIGLADEIWVEGAFDSLYLFDQFDHTIQNLNMLVGMEQYGIDKAQVSRVQVSGFEEIEVSHNPGYLHNEDGFLVSIQWLNYWSPYAQSLLPTRPPWVLPPTAQMVRLDDGSIRLQLSEFPGRYDDETFHLLQLEVRRALGFPP